MHIDLRAVQSGDKRSEHHCKPATVASLPRRLGESLTQTTLPWQALGRDAAAPSAPPAYSLRNRSNFCCLNSVAVALHWSMISSGGNPRLFGSLGPALAVLSPRTLELPTHATWKELLQGRPAARRHQADVIHY